MKRLITLALAGLALIATTPPAYAAKGLKPGAVRLDPALGYVLVRIGPTSGKKFKSPALYLWRFDPATNEVRTRRKKDPARVPKGEDDSVVLGDRVFLAGDKSSVYIASMTPGDWVVHGSYKTCLCLGSYRFTVAPGEITDIGTVLIASEAGGLYIPDLPRQPLAPDLEERPYAVPEAILVKAATDTDLLPPEVAGLPLKRAALIPDIRFTNRGSLRYLYYGGILVNRAAGLPAPVSGDAKAIVDRVMKAADEKEVVAKPVLEGEEPKPVSDKDDAAVVAPVQP
jgi:hypothetical protein